MKSFPEPLPDGQGTMWSGVRAPKEGALKAAVLTMLQKLPWSDFVWVDRIFVGEVRTAWGSNIVGARTGTADICGHIRAKAPRYRGAKLAIELKRDRYAKLSPEQIVYLSDVVLSGGVGIAGIHLTQIEDELMRALLLQRSEDGRTLVPWDPPTRGVRFPWIPGFGQG
jgi:hypothetical protein